MSIVSCRYGDFSMPDRNDLVLNAMRKYGEWGQLEIDALAQFIRTGDRVVDAGAFIGTHTRAFSQMVGSEGMVYAFEPNPETYEYLSENIKFAPHSNIEAYQVALGDQAALGVLSTGEGNSGETQVSEGLADAEGISVRIQKLDDFELGGISFIKADLEGMEYPMLVGAEETITRCHPVIFLEANSLEASYPILAWAEARGYVVFGLLSAAFNPMNFNTRIENEFGNSKECGLLLIHRDQLASREACLVALNLPVIDTIDRLGLLLLHKPQYLHEVLEGTPVADALGLNIPTSQVTELASQVTELEQQIQALRVEVSERDGRLKQILGSHSWRLTKPLRFVGRLLRGDFEVRPLLWLGNRRNDQ